MATTWRLERRHLVFVFHNWRMVKDMIARSRDYEPNSPALQTSPNSAARKNDPVMTIKSSAFAFCRAICQALRELEKERQSCLPNSDAIATRSSTGTPRGLF